MWETFCGGCFFCKHGYVNNCTDPNGGWALGRRIDGGQAEYVRVPFADQGLNRIPDSVTDEQALFVGDILATGFWAARISEIQPEDTVLIIGAGPTGICTLLCAMLQNPKAIIVCEKRGGKIVCFFGSITRRCWPVHRKNVKHMSRLFGNIPADVVTGIGLLKSPGSVPGPNAIVTVVARYEEAQILPLPQMYGKMPSRPRRRWL